MYVSGPLFFKLVSVPWSKLVLCIHKMVSVAMIFFKGLSFMFSLLFVLIVLCFTHVLFVKDAVFLQLLMLFVVEAGGDTGLGKQENAREAIISYTVAF